MAEQRRHSWNESPVAVVAVWLSGLIGIAGFVLWMLTPGEWRHGDEGTRLLVTPVATLFVIVLVLLLPAVILATCSRKHRLTRQSLSLLLFLFLSANCFAWYIFVNTWFQT